MENQASWMDGMTFLQEPAGTKHTVGEDEIVFLPASAHYLVKAKPIIKTLSKALNVLFQDKSADNGSIQRQFTGEEPGTEIIVEAVSPETLKLRSSQSSQAIDELVDTVANESNLELVCAIILDSMRKEFKDKNKTPPPAKEFMNTVSIPVLIQLLTGVSKANGGSFGPLTERLSKLTDLMVKKIENQVASEGGEAEEKKEAEEKMHVAGTVLAAPPPPPVPVQMETKTTS